MLLAWAAQSGGGRTAPPSWRSPFAWKAPALPLSYSPPDMSSPTQPNSLYFERPKECRQWGQKGKQTGVADWGCAPGRSLPGMPLFLALGSIFPQAGTGWLCSISGHDIFYVAPPCLIVFPD